MNLFDNKEKKMKKCDRCRGGAHSDVCAIYLAFGQPNTTCLDPFKRAISLDMKRLPRPFSISLFVSYNSEIHYNLFVYFILWFQFHFEHQTFKLKFQTFRSPDLSDLQIVETLRVFPSKADMINEISHFNNFWDFSYFQVWTRMAKIFYHINR